MDKQYKIVEEVPGAPKEERFYVTGPDIFHPLPMFATISDAWAYLRGRGIEDAEFEAFEP